MPLRRRPRIDPGSSPAQSAQPTSNSQSPATSPIRAIGTSPLMRWWPVTKSRLRRWSRGASTCCWPKLRLTRSCSRRLCLPLKMSFRQPASGCRSWLPLLSLKEDAPFQRRPSRPATRALPMPTFSASVSTVLLDQRNCGPTWPTSRGSAPGWSAATPTPACLMPSAALMKRLK